MQIIFYSAPVRYGLVFWLASVSFFRVDVCKAEPPVTPQPAESGMGALTGIPITLSLKHASMSAVIADLAKQSGRNLLVSDTPRSNQADIDFTGNLKDALDEVANAYDYTWSLNKRGVVFLTKRFMRSEEHPQLLASELREIAKDNIAIFNAFNIDFMQMGPKVILSAYEALTPEQRAYLQSGGNKSIAAAQLSPEQHRQLEKVIQFNLLVHQHYHWTQTLPALEILMQAAPASSLRMTREERDPPAHTSETEEEKARFPWPRQWEMVQYLVVDKRGKVLPVSLYNQSIVSPSAALPVRAGDQEKKP